MRRVLLQINSCVLFKAATCERGHINIEMRNVITLRTRSLEATTRYDAGVALRELNFSSKSGQEERFMVSVHSDDPTILVELRQDRFLFRSRRVASLVLSLASMVLGEPRLFSALEMTDGDGNVVATLTLEALLIIPGAGDATTTSSTSGAAFGGEKDAAAVAATAKPKSVAVAAVVPLRTAAPPPLPLVLSAMLEGEARLPPTPVAHAAKKSIRHRGTMTDLVVVWPEDVGENVRAPPSSAPSEGPAPVVAEPCMASFVPAAALTPDAEVIGDAGLRARKKMAIAWPTDEMEGLMLYCEMLQNEKRVAESRLAQFHIGKALSRTKKL